MQLRLRRGLPNTDLARRRGHGACGYLPEALRVAQQGAVRHRVRGELARLDRRGADRQGRERAGRVAGKHSRVHHLRRGHVAVGCCKGDDANVIPQIA